MTMKFSRSIDKEIALEVSHVSKSFKLPTERSGSLKNAIFNWIRGVRGYKTQHVLDDISFTVHKGDFFGIVGQNGSGKSTLLKIISQIYTPDSGTVQVNGKLVPFIELGVGFNPELTGRENVYLNGAMLGFSHDEIDAMYDDIVDFAELGDFMEQKLKNYSSGMQVRLAFSVAIKSQGDILVLDEVLAVGDEAFQKKCQDYFFEAKRSKKTIILVTHSMPDVRKYCNKAMFIKDGRIEKIGAPDEVANAYSDMFIERQRKNILSENQQISDVLGEGRYIHITDISIMDRDQEAVSMLAIHQDFVIQARLECEKDLENTVFAINIIDQQGRVAVATSTRVKGQGTLFTKGTHVVTFKVENVLPFGDYHINVAAESNFELLLKKENVYKFGVSKDAEYNQVLMHPHVDVVVR